MLSTTILAPTRAWNERLPLPSSSAPCVANSVIVVGPSGTNTRAPSVGTVTTATALQSVPSALQLHGDGAPLAGASSAALLTVNLDSFLAVTCVFISTDSCTGAAAVALFGNRCFCTRMCSVTPPFTRCWCGMQAPTCRCEEAVLMSSPGRVNHAWPSM